LVTPFPNSLTRCPRSKPGEIFWLYTIAIIVEAGGFILLLLKAYGVWRDSVYTPFITALIKQGGMYYCIVFGIVVLMTTATVSPKIYLPLVDANIVVPICSVTSNRLVLSLRERWTSNKVDDQDSSIKPTSIESTVEFGANRSAAQEAGTLQSHSQTDSRFTDSDVEDSIIEPPPRQISFQPPHPYSSSSSSTRLRSYSSPRVDDVPSKGGYMMSPISPARGHNSLTIGTLAEGQTMDHGG